MKYLSNFKFSVSKKFLLIALGTLVVLALLAFGIVRQVQYSKAQAVSEHNALVARQEHDKALKAEVARSSALLTKATAKGDAACAYLKQLSLAASTRRLVTVPPVCNL
jgi:sensor domain CHASE-containing protein